ncbi:hypothetical protein BDV96DRAFT_591546 [Lophiotrema nucula]|uniref:Uncharacterized protein n=1 Tax=Lophiotrema nucula TaxID=690887 RepID=A0A6A5YGH9_9PLEO|nr:hypothetical protein BDV96DRAFT_591546 [Lophiotrema nucula]
MLLQLRQKDGTINGYGCSVDNAGNHPVQCEWRVLQHHDRITAIDESGETTTYEKYDIVDVLYNTGEKTNWETGKALLLELCQDPGCLARTYFVFIWVYELGDVAARLLKGKRYIASNQFDVLRVDRFRAVQSAEVRVNMRTDAILDCGTKSKSVIKLSTLTQGCIAQALRTS